MRWVSADIPKASVSGKMPFKRVPKSLDKVRPFQSIRHLDDWGSRDRTVSMEFAFAPTLAQCLVDLQQAYEHRIRRAVSESLTRALDDCRKKACSQARTSRSDAFMGVLLVAYATP